MKEAQREGGGGGRVRNGVRAWLRVTRKAHHVDSPPASPRRTGRILFYKSVLAASKRKKWGGEGRGRYSPRGMEAKFALSEDDPPSPSFDARSALQRQQQHTGTRRWADVEMRLSSAASFAASPCSPEEKDGGDGDGDGDGALEGARRNRLTLVVFAHAWSPEAKSAASVARSLDPDDAAVYVLDADAEDAKCDELGIVTTPALLFYWGDRPMAVKRQGWNVDVKWQGCIAKDDLRRLCERARACGTQEGNACLELDCEF